MSRPVIISCAVTGTLPDKVDNPALPVTPSEQIESIQQAYEAGASVVHLHVRDDEGLPTSDPERFRVVVEGVRRHCPDMIIQLSTMGPSQDPQERGACLDLHPDMATLVPGSFNYFNRTLVNTPDMIEQLADRMGRSGVRPEFAIFDLSMLFSAKALVHAGLARDPLHVQFLLGIPGALPAMRHLLDVLVTELHDLSSGATWVATGIGRHQETVMDWALYRGGHLRTGLGNNLRLSPTELAPSNAELVRRAAAHCSAVGAFVATPREARTILGIDWATDRPPL